MRILNLSLLSNSQIPRTFFCPRYPSPKSSPSGRGLTLATRAQKWCFALAKLESYCKKLCPSTGEGAHFHSKVARKVRPNREKYQKIQKFLVIFKKWLIFAVPNEGIRGVAQLASASGLGPEGPVFESQYPDKGRGDDDESPPFLIAETLRAHSPVERLAKPA